MQIPIQGSKGTTFAIPINVMHDLSNWNLHWYKFEDVEKWKQQVRTFKIEAATKEIAQELCENKWEARRVAIEFFQWLGADTSHYLLWYNSIPQNIT